MPKIYSSNWQPLGARTLLKRGLVIATSLSFILLASCGGGSSGSDQAKTAKSLNCDDSMKAEFKPDALTTVLAVRAFKKGEVLSLAETPSAGAPTAQNDLCMVKLLVGPGNPGPSDAPSTSAGIGIEVWLPTRANWNSRIHNIGGGGWQGGGHGLANVIAAYESAAVAGSEGAVSSITDTGHKQSTGAFMMNPDGSINQALWHDFASRGIKEQATKTRALAIAYYGTPPEYSYFEGSSTGGRQGLNLAQNNPDLYDGIIANLPAINWTRFGTAGLYPQYVYIHDLDSAPISQAQQDMVSNAAIRACDFLGGQHLGFILDPQSCRYDPTMDAGVLCVAGGGTNATADCISPTQAAAMNKFWYGPTADGAAPSPATDNGWGQPDSYHRWYGQTRGTSLYGASFSIYGIRGMTAVDGPSPLAVDQLALQLQNPTLAEPVFKNATGNGADGWKLLSYAQFSASFDRGIALQSSFGNINTDNPDLSKFKARGGKMLAWHGLNDEIIPPQGSINYYERVVGAMGGLSAVQSFYKLYMISGGGHGVANGTSNPDANPPAVAPGQMYALLRDWVERGIEPAGKTVTSQEAAGERSLPMCAFPAKATYVSGNPNRASSYTCQ